MSVRWRQRPPGSNWGDFGDDDRLGRLNLVTPARRRAALSEARDGLVFCLSLPLEVGAGLNPSRFPPRLEPTTKDGRARYNFCACEEIPGLTDVVCDDKVTLYTQYSTQWDALCHAGSLFDADGDGVAETVYYNGFPAAWKIGTSALGIEHMAASCVQGRGVLIDLARHAGAKRVRVGYEQLMTWMAEDGVEVEEGDFLCLHTGFAQYVLDVGTQRDPTLLRSFGPVLDGAGQRLLSWIAESGVAAVIADNVAIEERVSEVPSGYRGPLLPLHEHCLFKLGVHLGEMWHLTPLAQWLHSQSRSRFLLTAPPLRLAGAAGSPLTPVATV